MLFRSKKAEVSAKAYALAQKAMSLGSAAVNAVIQPLTKLPGLFAQLTVAQDMATKKQILYWKNYHIMETTKLQEG